MVKKFFLGVLLSAMSILFVVIALGYPTPQNNPDLNTEPLLLPTEHTREQEISGSPASSSPAPPEPTSHSEPSSHEAIQGEEHNHHVPLDHPSSMHKVQEIPVAPYESAAATEEDEDLADSDDLDDDDEADDD